MQHDDTLARKSAVKHTSDTVTAFYPKLEKPIAERTGVWFTKVTTINFHSVNEVLVPDSYAQWILVNLKPYFFAVVLNSVVHTLKYNEIVMLMQALDHLISGSYTVSAPYKTGAGRGNPESNSAHNRAQAVFLCAKHCHTRIMVGRAGQSSGWPVSEFAGISTPVRLTTHKRGNFGGELSKLRTEAAIMATFPTLDHPEFSREELTPLRHADHLNIILDTMQYLSTRSSADARIQLVRLLLVARTHGQKLREELFRIENDITLTSSTPASKRGQQ